MVGEVIISGTIGSYSNENGDYVKGVELRDVVASVRAQGDIDSLIVKISSYGGIEKESDDIFNYLRSLPYQVDTLQVGPIASAAVKIFLAGKEKTYNPAYDFFIHNTRLPLPKSGSIDKNDAAKMLSVLSSSSEDLLNFYAKETGNTVEALRPYMDKQTSLVGDEPLSFGFATKKNEEDLVLAILHKNKTMSKLDELIKNIKAFAGVNAMIEMKLADGKAVVIEAEPGQEVGASVMVEGQPAPVGEHQLEGGKILVVTEAGKVAEIKDAAAPVEVEDKKYEELKANVDKLTAAVSGLVEAQVKANATVVASIEEKITALKSQITSGHRPDQKSVKAVITKQSPADEYLKRK